MVQKGILAQEMIYINKADIIAITFECSLVPLLFLLLYNLL